MKLMRVMKKVYCEPWLIRPDFHARISEIVMRHVNGDEKEIKAAVAALGIEIDEEECELKAEMIDGVSIIPIRGVIGKRVGMLEKTSGVMDIEDVNRMMDQAMTDPNVRAIILDIDSPGGTVGGVMELAENIRFSRTQKPIWSYTDGDMDSSAYWIGSATGHIAATPSASVGSIGVYLPVIDQSKAFEMNGYKAEVIKAGALKAIGVPGTSLTDEQRAHLQEQVNYLADQFKYAVIEGRNKRIADDVMQGQAFYGSQALRVGLIDDVVSGRQSVLDGIKRML